MTFTLDSNIIINLENRYPRDIFTSLWVSIETLSVQGDVCICELVLSELARGDDGLGDWARSLTGFVCETSREELLTVREISDAHPSWVRGQKNQGDPFVIAHAKHQDRIIVTEEQRRGAGTAEHNQTIPFFADEHGVACIRFLEFVKSQGWTF